MSNTKYHTIDPQILESLNLSKARINHLVQLLHPSNPFTPDKTISKSLRTPRQQSTLLPVLIPTTRKIKHNTTTLESVEESSRSNRSNNKSKDLKTSRGANINIPVNMSLAEKLEDIQANRRYRSRNPEKSSRQERTQQQQAEYVKMQAERLGDKVQRTMREYMSKKLSRSKSQQINPKDLYRLEIQSIIAEPTPIADLQRAQTRMKRLKQRHRHLHSFDFDYYSRLNQHDFLILF